MKRLWFRSLIVLLSVSTLGVWYAVAHWPRALRLGLYTSPAITVNGETSVVQVLVPVNWRAVAPRREFFVTKSGETATIFFSAADNETETLRTLRKVFGVERSLNVGMRLTFGESSEASERKILVEGVEKCDSSSTPLRRAIRNLYGGKTRHTLSFTYENGPEFDSTYRQICESFRVVR